MAEERRKRKQRGGDRDDARGYARAEERNQAAREALKPLAEGERPTVVTVGAVVAGADRALDRRRLRWPG